GITVYGRIPAAGAVPVAGERLFTGAAWRPAAGDSARLDLALARPLWGFKAFYEADGTLVLRVRRPPRVDAGRPLEGVRVLVDPGHPPLGAVGPTGLTEADANLAIGLRLAERLRERGAEVVMTRVDDTPLVSRTDVAAELAARTALAVRSDAHLLVSVHNNAFPEGINPFVSAGTETYYFYPFAAELAQALNREIVDATRIRNLGAKRRSLALARPTWMPSTLTESLFMMIPEQEAALRNPAFLDRLADAHLRGIEAFVRERGESVR
ncbi:MAG: N-acetylmuramoyl-L-alanine amidase, partial [Gemmatimonadota bacterium]|nr:N-acetylmuramoyl-L-alanine amidase [Gemmatimonadota bacterium]